MEKDHNLLKIFETFIFDAWPQKRRHAFPHYTDFGEYISL